MGNLNRVTLTHIGAVSLGRLLAIWSFVLGLISLIIYGVIMAILAVLGVASGTTDLVSTLVGVAIMLAMGVVGLILMAIAMFIFGFLAAIVYNIILGVGGGIDFDFRER